MKKIALCILSLALVQARAADLEEKERRLSLQDMLGMPPEIITVEPNHEIQPSLEPEYDYDQLLAQNPIKFHSTLRRMIMPTSPKQKTRRLRKRKQSLDSDLQAKLEKSIAMLATIREQLDERHTELDHQASQPCNGPRTTSLCFAVCWVVATCGTIGAQAYFLYHNFSPEIKIATAIPLAETAMTALKKSLKNIGEVVHNTPIDKELENNEKKIKSVREIKKELQAKIRVLTRKDDDQDDQIHGIQDRLSALETRIALGPLTNNEEE